MEIDGRRIRPCFYSITKRAHTPTPMECTMGHDQRERSRHRPVKKKINSKILQGTNIRQVCVDISFLCVILNDYSLIQEVSEFFFYIILSTMCCTCAALYVIPCWSAHVHSRSGSVGSFGNRIVHPDPPTINLHTITALLCLEYNRQMR